MSFFSFIAAQSADTQFWVGFLCGVVVSMALFGSVLVWFMRGFASLKSSAVEGEKMLRENENKLRDSYQQEIQALKKEIKELKIGNAFSEYYVGRKKA